MMNTAIQQGTVPHLTGYSPGFNRVRLSIISVLFSILCLSGCEKGEAEDESVPVEAGPEISRIALGSCAHQDKNQIIWEPIVATDPDLFLFLGDNIYGDTNDMAVMRAKYQKLAEKPGYQKLKATCPILAVWDDHDYGVNDGGKDYEMKVQSEEVFHEFFETPAESEVLQHPGTYQTRYFGGEGRRLQVILLDTRYFRDSMVWLPETEDPGNGPYGRNRDPNATVLGTAQWAWLEKQLQVPADFRIIASSIQFLPQDHHWELWENFPLERAKLLNMLKTHVTNPVLFVSGDRHMGEIMELNTTDPLSPGYPVYELTSSGLTNAGGGRKGEPNRHRVSPTNFQSRNFGMVQIDWEKSKVMLDLRDVTGKVVDSFGISF
ncbi:MAG: alkaline phosphatase D family protein [Verrucomicrobiales bacterium]|nr:alkaline phosphatase D family protein [Verrucomicrobiales bacterium]